MTPGDTEAVLAMMRVFYDSPAVLTEVSEAVLRRDIADACGGSPLLRGYVFQEDGRLLGYAMAALCYATEYGGLCVWLEDLYLKPEARGRGLSSAFFDFLEREFPEAVRFKLEVEADNGPALRAYAARGYHPSAYVVMTKERP